MSRTAWIVTIGIYIAVASLVPVWILLQPRDYLSSFLLYGMMLLALVGIFVAAATGRSNFNIPFHRNSVPGTFYHRCLWRLLRFPQPHCYRYFF